MKPDWKSLSHVVATLHFSHRELGNFDEKSLDNDMTINQ
jgi:hypothetical protein